MTDKVQKIKDWISKEQDGLMDAQGNFEYPEHEGAYHILCNLDAYIDSLQEEPVSNPTPNEKMSVERWKKACEAACCDRNYRSHYGLTETRDDYFVDGVQWADEHPKEEPVSEDLEKSINFYIENNFFGSETLGFFSNRTKEEPNDQDIALAFKAGAMWQKEQMVKNVVLETKVYLESDGDGIESEHQEWLALENNEILDIPNNIGLKDGDKVKVIIIKDE